MFIPKFVSCWGLGRLDAKLHGNRNEKSYKFHGFLKLYEFNEIEYLTTWRYFLRFRWLNCIVRSAIFLRMGQRNNRRQELQGGVCKIVNKTVTFRITAKMSIS